MTFDAIVLFDATVNHRRDGFVEVKRPGLPGACAPVRFSVGELKGPVCDVALSITEAKCFARMLTAIIAGLEEERS